MADFTGHIGVRPKLDPMADAIDLLHPVLYGKFENLHRQLIRAHINCRKCLYRHIAVSSPISLTDNR